MVKPASTYSRPLGELLSATQTFQPARILELDFICFISPSYLEISPHPLPYLQNSLPSGILPFVYSYNMSPFKLHFVRFPLNPLALSEPLFPRFHAIDET